MTTEQHQSSGAEGADDRPINWLVIGLLLAAAFVVILNETTMTVALPHLMADMSVDARTGQWLTTGFLLTMAVVIPITGFAMQRLTTRAIFVLAMSVFSAGTLLAGLAPVFEVLLVARIVQACGTAIMLPLLMTTILNLVPKQRRGEVMGLVSIAMSVAPALGPTMSGLVLQWLGWRWIFFIVLPISIAALVVGALKLTNVNETARIPLDVPSVVLSAFGFGGLVFALSQIGSGGGSRMGLSFGIALIALALFVWRQLVLQRDDKPLLDLRTFQFRDFTVSIAVMMIAFMALMGTMLLWPIYLQDVRGVPSAWTGFMMLPGGLAMGLLGPVVGRLFDRFGARPLVVPAAISVSVMVFAMSRASMTSPLWLLLVLHLALMLSLGFMFTPTFTSGLNALTPKLYSHGSALLGTLQQVAGAAGSALLITLMQAHSQVLAADGAGPVRALEGGVQRAMMIASVIGVGAVLLALLLGNNKRAPAEGAAEATVPAEG